MKEVIIGNEVSFFPANKDEENKIIDATRKLLDGSIEVSKYFEKCKKLVDVVQYSLKTSNMNMYTNAVAVFALCS